MKNEDRSHQVLPTKTKKRKPPKSKRSMREALILNAVMNARWSKTLPPTMKSLIATQDDELDYDQTTDLDQNEDRQGEEE